MDKGLAKAFGLNLKKIRLEKNFSQEKLAFECELDRTFVSMLERGVRQPSLTTIFQIKHALKIPVSALVSPLESK